MEIAIIGEPEDVAYLTAALVVRKYAHSKWSFCTCECHARAGRCGIIECCPMAGNLTCPHLTYLSLRRPSDKRYPIICDF